MTKAEFERLKPGSVERVKKLKDFAFVHFKEREDALAAMRRMNGASIDGAHVEVTLSKPVDKASSARLTRQSVSPAHLLIDPNDMSILTLGGIASPHHAAAIPAFAFTDPITNLQYQIPSQHFQQQQQQQQLGHLSLPAFAPNSNIP
jgi:RNA recognition motif-containing protein